MKYTTHLCLICGLAAVILLVVWQGAGTVLGLLVTLGWGLLLLPLAWLPHLLAGTASWRLLFAPCHMPRFLVALRAMWVGGAINLLLPVASVGGEVVKGRLVTLDGVDGAQASASVTVDLTVQALSLLLWSLVGITALVVLEADRSLALAALAGAVLLALGIAGFWRVQRGGAFGFLARLSPKSPLVKSAAAIDQAIHDLYARPGRIFLATLIRLMGRVLLTGEVWLAAWLLGFPVGLLEALMLKSLTGALRGAAFPVPGGLGVQEGGYIVLGALVGYPPDVMLGLSLATRVRELLVSLPGLLAWQHVEGRALWQRVTTKSS
jgi:putative membrane protein